MAVSLITAGAVSNSANAGITATITAGDSLVLCVSGYRTGGYTTASVTDDAGNGAYTLLKRTTHPTITELTLEIWLFLSSTGATNPQITLTPTSGSGNFYANFGLHLRGVTSATLRDEGSGNGANTATDASATTAGSAAQVGDLVIAQAVAAIAGDTNVTWGATTTGYTNAGAYADFSANTSQSVDYKSPSAGSQSAQFAHDATTGAGNGWLAQIIVLNGGGGGGGSGKPWAHYAGMMGS